MFLRYQWLEWALPLIQKQQSNSEDRENEGKNVNFFWRLISQDCKEELTE